MNDTDKMIDLIRDAVAGLPVKIEHVVAISDPTFRIVCDGVETGMLIRLTDGTWWHIFLPSLHVSDAFEDMRACLARHLNMWIDIRIGAS